MEKKYVYNQPLIKNLKKHNYKFLWFGNSLMNCSMYNQDFCFDNNKKSIFDPNVYYGFFKQSPLIKIYKKAKSKLNSTKCSYRCWYSSLDRTILQYFFDTEKNDSLNEFIKTSKNLNLKNKGYFFFIHAMMPHSPFVFHSNCKLKKGLISSDGKYGVNENYKENYECMLKRVDQFTKFIEKNDPDANVIITSDHGSNTNLLPNIRHSTFTLNRINKKCKNNNVEMNLTNQTLLLLACTFEEKYIFVKKKNYSEYFKKGKLNIGGNYNLKRLDL